MLFLDDERVVVEEYEDPKEKIDGAVVILKGLGVKVERGGRKFQEACQRMEEITREEARKTVDNCRRRRRGI